MSPEQRLGRLMGAAEMYLQTGATVDRTRLAIVLNEEYQLAGVRVYAALPTDRAGEADLLAVLHEVRPLVASLAAVFQAQPNTYRPVLEHIDAVIGPVGDRT